MNSESHHLSLNCEEALSEPSFSEFSPSNQVYFSPDYLSYFSLLSENFVSLTISNAFIRLDMIDFIFKISAKLFITRETAYSAIFILDKSTQGSCDLIIQLFAAAALLISSKFLEKKPIKIKTLIKYFNYTFTPAEVIATELKILKILNYRIPFTNLSQ